jgi:alpha/beta hydrolase family protein
MTRRLARFSLPLAVLIVVLAGCASTSGSPSAAGGEAHAESESPVEASSTPSPDLDQVSGMFDIGDGRELYLRCSGTGSPTILLEAGDEDGVSAWTFVIPALMTETRTCAYDRAGNGQSDPATGCRGLDDLLGDLEALLAAADIDGPFVLVGASGGGFLMAGFAARHPEDVAGLVLVETPKALTAEAYPEIVPLIACDAPSNIERRDYVAVEHAVWDNRAEIGDFPMAIISNQWANPPGPDEETNVEDQQGWLILSPNSTQTVVTTGHDVASNEPQLVIDQILAVLEAAR